MGLLENKTSVSIMKQTIERTFYRNGQLREAAPLQNGRRHGVVRVWHKNGQLASEEHFQDGLLHGVCQQWDESGRLLGEYEMISGTGLQCEWYDNGRLQLEISTVHGAFTGRNRMWLRDGTLLSERFYLNGKIVSFNAYRKAASKDTSLPRFRGKPANLPPEGRATEKHILDVFVHSLLEKPNRSEARAWLTRKTCDQTTRSLGRFQQENDVVELVEALYKVGGINVIVPDIYGNKAHGQFSDCLIVELPTVMVRRKAIRKVCAQLKARGLGAVQPDKDIGEEHLYLSLA
jgi:hypothetical protein